MKQLPLVVLLATMVVAATALDFSVSTNEDGSLDQELTIAPGMDT